MCNHLRLSSLLALIFCVVIILFSTRVSLLMAASLKGKHLIILPTQLQKYMETKVNSSGHVIETNGCVPEMLNWLSNRLQFNFSYMPSVAYLTVDDTPNKPGKLSYLKNHKAEMAVGAIVMTPQRYEQADFPMPWQWSSYGVVVPFPKTTVKFGSLSDPWQLEVWIGLALAIPIYIFCLGGLVKCSNLVRKISNNQKESPNSRVISLNSITKYVLGVLLSQAGYFENSLLVIRLATAAWCLACFVLVQSYSSTLISFLTLPQFPNNPIINSIYDVPKVKNLQVVTDRGLASDVLLSTADSGIFKQFGTMLKNYPDLRCNKSEQCVDRVKSGSYVYIGGEYLLDLAVQADYKKEGNCHIIILNERFQSSLIGFAISKQNGYMEEFNQGIEEMIEYGLVQYWNKKYLFPDKLLCHFENERQPAASAKTRLSLNNLASAFVLLLLGYLLSFLVLLIEIVARFSIKVY